MWGSGWSIILKVFASQVRRLFHRMANFVARSRSFAMLWWTRNKVERRQNAVWAQCNNDWVKKRKQIRVPRTFRFWFQKESYGVLKLETWNFRQLFAWWWFRIAALCMWIDWPQKQENGGNLDLVHGCRTEILQKFDEYIYFKDFKGTPSFPYDLWGGGEIGGGMRGDYFSTRK